MKKLQKKREKISAVDNLKRKKLKFFDELGGENGRKSACKNFVTFF